MDEGGEVRAVAHDVVDRLGVVEVEDGVVAGREGGGEQREVTHLNSNIVGVMLWMGIGKIGNK